MVFNSGVYIYFLSVVLLIYWLLYTLPNGVKLQNRFLLVTSYIFYGYWDWIFLVLIALSTGIDYYAARKIENSNKLSHKKLYLSLSVIFNLGTLGIFKYYDFFISEFVELCQNINPAFFPEGGDSLLLNVILPVGISFYTFQTMSYTIDVYRKQIPAEKNLLDFSLFVCFFPQLVAGPIERAGILLPQLKNPRKFNPQNFAEGAWLFLYGFFMKTFVADNLGILVNLVFLDGKEIYNANPLLASGHGGFQVFAAAIAFIFQIYCDFAGYSNIALGTALFLGIKLSTNFSTPQLSQNPAELWRRWHITLNRWVTDYIYIPLGGSRLGAFRKNLNLFIAFMLMGFWHGANWTFILWGAFNGIMLILHNVFSRRLPDFSNSLHPLLHLPIRSLKMIAVFLMFSFSGILFRCYDLNHIIYLCESLFTFPWDLNESINNVPAAGKYAAEIFGKIALLMILDISAYYYKDDFWIFKRPVWLRAIVYSSLFFAIVIMGFFGRNVIYFAF